jgi:hypothetical protein
MTGIMLGRIVRNAAPAVKPRIPLSLPLPWERAGVRENRHAFHEAEFLILCGLGAFVVIFLVSRYHHEQLDNSAGLHIIQFNLITQNVDEDEYAPKRFSESRAAGSGSRAKAQERNGPPSERAKSSSNPLRKLPPLSRQRV